MSKGVTWPAGAHSPMSARRPKSINGIMDFSSAGERIRQKLRLRPRRQHIPVIVKPDSSISKAQLSSYMIDPAYRKHADPLPPRHHQARDYKVIHFSQLPSLFDEETRTWYKDGAGEWWDEVRQDVVTITEKVRSYITHVASVLKGKWGRVNEAIVLFTATMRYGFLKSKKRLTGVHYKVNTGRHRGILAKLSKTWIVAGGMLAGMVVAFLVLLNPGGDLPPYPAPKETSNAGGGSVQTTDKDTATTTNTAPAPSANQQPVSAPGAPKTTLPASAPQTIKPKSEAPLAESQTKPAPTPSLPVEGYGGGEILPVPTPTLPYVPPKPPSDTLLIPPTPPEAVPTLLNTTVNTVTTLL